MKNNKYKLNCYVGLDMFNKKDIYLSNSGETLQRDNPARLKTCLKFSKISLKNQIIFLSQTLQSS